MAQKTLGVGFLGCGRIADLQCLGYLEHPRAEIVAVCDSDEDRARRRGLSWGAQAVYTDVDRFLADRRVELVEILTPHHLHARHAIAALEAGKHVSLQKPPARDLEELDRIARAVGASGLTLRVFENFMHYPPHLKARELVEEGAIGVPLAIRMKTAAGRPEDGWEVEQASLAWRVDRGLCGGGPVTFDHGFHIYSMARFFIPADVERVHAFIEWSDLGGGRRYDGPAMVSWTYHGEPRRMGSWEVVASVGMRVRSNYYAEDDRMEIHGSEGVIWVNRCTGALLEEPAVVLYRDGETRAFHDLNCDWAESFRAGGCDMVDALAGGRAAGMEIGEARTVLAMALAVGLSAAEGREVSLGEISAA